ncbi:UNVERIFIED_CONTAM: hypothetical protein Sindi_1107800 [Sesamum indicum]
MVSSSDQASFPPISAPTGFWMTDFCLISREVLVDNLAVWRHGFYFLEVVQCVQGADWCNDEGILTLSLKIVS